MLFARGRFRTTGQVSLRHPARALAFLFLLLIFVGAVLLRLPISARDEPVSWSTAFFTATSAVSLTGLAVTDTATTFSLFGQCVLLALVQAGGLGYMLTATLLFFLFRHTPTFHHKMLRDALGPVTYRDALKITLRAVTFTLTVEAIGMIVLAVRFAQEPFMDWPTALWRGLFHSVSAFCNAGFDLFGNDGHGLASLAYFRSDPVVNFTIAGLITVGSLGFVACNELAFRAEGSRPQYRPLSLHTRLVLAMTFWLTLAGMLAVAVCEWSNPKTLGELDAGHKLLAAFFQSITLRSAGYSTIDFQELRSITLLFMGVFMFIGASPGGTGGGIKTTTFAAMLAVVKATLKNEPDAEVFNRRLPTEIVFRAIVLILLSLAVIVAGIFLLTFTEPNNLREAGFRENLFMQIQFEVISAFGTVGLSTGLTPALSDTGRVVLMTLMFLGRLGPTAAAALLASVVNTSHRRLPSEGVSLG